MLKGTRLLAIAVIAGILSAVTSGLAPVETGGMAGGMVSAAVTSVVVGLFLLPYNGAGTAVKIAGKCAVAGAIMVVALSLTPWDIPLGAVGLGGAIGVTASHSVKNPYLWETKPKNIGNADERG